VALGHFAAQKSSSVLIGNALVRGLAPRTRTHMKAVKVLLLLLLPPGLAAGTPVLIAHLIVWPLGHFAAQQPSSDSSATL